MLSHFSHIWLCMNLWTLAHQAPLSIGFSRQEYWSGLPCPSPGDLPDPGIEPMTLRPPALAGRYFTTSATWEAQRTCILYSKCSLLHQEHVTYSCVQEHVNQEHVTHSWCNIKNFVTCHRHDMPMKSKPVRQRVPGSNYEPVTFSWVTLEAQCCLTGVSWSFCGVWLAIQCGTCEPSMKKNQCLYYLE